MLKNNNTRIFNLTPHDINIYDASVVDLKSLNGTSKLVLKTNVKPTITIPSDGVGRINFNKSHIDNGTGIPMIKMIPCGYHGIPDDLGSGDIIIVSGVMAGNIDFVKDMTSRGVIVCVVGDTVWSDDFKAVIGCVNLSRIN